LPTGRTAAVAGVVVIWAGLAVRIWAVLTLAGSFSTFIQVNTDQTVVTRGPYRWVRHPSYTGLLLIALGFGLSAGNWLSLLICTAGTDLRLPCPATPPRPRRWGPRTPRRRDPQRRRIEPYPSPDLAARRRRHGSDPG
jgi:hypothetical protein